MLRTPALNPRYAFELVEGEGVAVFGDGEELFLAGQLYVDVVRRVDGATSVDDLASSAGSEWGVAQAYYGLNVLEQARFIVEAFEAPPGHAAFWTTRSAHPDAAIARVARTPVRVAVLGGLPGDPFEQAISSAGFDLVRGVTPQAGAVAIFADDYLHPEIAGLAHEARQHGTVVLLVRPMGDAIWLGPVFEPTGAGCWHCLAARLRFNRSRERMLRGPEGPAAIRRARAWTDSTLGLAAHHAAQQLTLRAVHGASGGLGLSIVTLEQADLRARRHVVQPFPQCPECGDPGLALRGTGAIALRPASRLVPNDAGLRTRSAEETLQACEHLVSPITGIVDDLVAVREASSFVDVPVTVGLVCEPFTRSGPRYWESRILAAGKGTNATQARASALCEAVERHSSCFRGDEPRLRARFRELPEAAVHPAQLLQFSAAQYADRERYNSFYSHPKYWVPMPFDDERAIEWSRAWSLTGSRAVLLPTALCYFGYADPAEDGPRFARADSNGTAAGNTIEEAILQGLLELVERDATAMWWFNRAGRPQVDLHACDEIFVRQAVRRHRAANRELWALDLTSDLGVPVVAAISRRTAGAEEIVYGFGCHLDPRIALLRALTECDQSLVAALRLAANRSDHFDQDRRTWLREGRLADHPYLAPAQGAAASGRGDASASTGSLKGDIELLTARLGGAGSETIVLDMSRPDMPLAVVKMFSLGLCHPWRRLGSQRLFELPVCLGWLQQARAESDMNRAVKL